MKNFQKQIQSGRTMVEMIAVICLMALLSLGGIAGYRTAYNSYRANAVIDIVLQGKIAIETNKRNSSKETLQIYAEKTSLNCPSGSCADMRLSGNNKIFTLSSMETNGVCEKIVEKFGGNAGNKTELDKLGITVSPTSCGQASSIKMNFSFQVKQRKSYFSD